MTVFLGILLIAAMIATVAALVRGVVIFLKTTEEDLKGTGPSVAGMRSNKMMQMRVFFQALAILIVVLILFLRSPA